MSSYTIITKKTPYLPDCVLYDVTTIYICESIQPSAYVVEMKLQGDYKIGHILTEEEIIFEKL